jgi:phosphoinositide-3-kinase regulatory subunit alpha/beta/delta
LTLKKDGTDRVIKIFHNNGRYGFLKEASFGTVVELINRHRTISLKEYNSVLDIKLLYPVSRFAYDDEYHNLMENKDALVQKFVDVTTDVKNLTVILEQSHESQKRTENDIGFKRQAHEAFTEAETMFKEQIDIQNRYKEEAQPHEKQKLDENSELLQQRLTALKDCKKNLESDLDQQRRQFQKIELDINKLKLEISALLRQEKRLKQMMQAQNISDTLIKQIMEEGTSAWTNQDSAEHLYEETSWYFPKFSRHDAERYLKDAPVGTFLIRLSTNTNAYALSIVANGTVNHCIIYQTDNGTFGFAEPYNIYKSLKELVLHYSINSLEEHNESLQTTLKIPYYAYAQSSSSSTISSLSNV